MIEGIVRRNFPCVVFTDDILVTGASDCEHLQNLQEVLTHLEKAGLKLRKSKCAFMLTSVEYQGHVISEGLKLTADKVRALAEAPVVKDISQLWSLPLLCQVLAKPVYCPSPVELAATQVCDEFRPLASSPHL